MIQTIYTGMFQQLLMKLNVEKKACKIYTLQAFYFLL